MRATYVCITALRQPARALRKKKAEAANGRTQEQMLTYTMREGKHLRASTAKSTSIKTHTQQQKKKKKKEGGKKENCNCYNSSAWERHVWVERVYLLSLCLQVGVIWLCSLNSLCSFAAIIFLFFLLELTNVQLINVWLFCWKRQSSNFHLTCMFFFFLNLTCCWWFWPLGVLFECFGKDAHVCTE